MCWEMLNRLFDSLRVSNRRHISTLFSFLLTLLEYKFIIDCCVFFLTDALLRKAFSTPSFQGYNFVSSLLVLLGLIKVQLICTYSALFATVWKHVFLHLHISLFYISLLAFLSIPLSCPLCCSEWGQGEACAGGSRPPPQLGARCSTGLLPQRERGCAASLHVPVRTWQNERISRHLAGTKFDD